MMLLFDQLRSSLSFVVRKLSQFMRCWYITYMCKLTLETCMSFDIKFTRQGLRTLVDKRSQSRAW